VSRWASARPFLEVIYPEVIAGGAIATGDAVTVSSA
jgi:hypothetical protein